MVSLDGPDWPPSNFSNWQNKSVKLAYRFDNSIQTLTRYSDLTQTNVVVQTAFVQDSAGRLKSIDHNRPGYSAIGYTYKSFADGQSMEETSSIDLINSFDYDATGQLTTSTKSAGTNEAYAYDKTGNRLVGSTVIGKGNRILNCHWALQNQPLMGASKPAEVWMFSKWSEAGFEDSRNCCEPVF